MLLHMRSEFSILLLREINFLFENFCFCSLSEGKLRPGKGNTHTHTLLANEFLVQIGVDSHIENSKEKTNNSQTNDAGNTHGSNSKCKSFLTIKYNNKFEKQMKQRKKTKWKEKTTTRKKSEFTSFSV